MGTTFCISKYPIEINVLRSRDLSSVPCFHLKKIPSTSIPYLCSCSYTAPQQHETLLFPNFVDENFGIQVSNFTFEPSTPSTCIAVLLYVNDQLSYTTFLPRGSQKIIHSVRVATSQVLSSFSTDLESNLQVGHPDYATNLGSPCEQCEPLTMLSFPICNPTHESLLKSYLASSTPVEFSNTCPTPESDHHHGLILQTDIPKEHVRIELCEVEPLDTSERGPPISPLSNFHSSTEWQLKDPTLRSGIYFNSNTSPFSSIHISNEARFIHSFRKYTPHPLAVIHLFFLSFQTICELVNLPNIVHEIEGDGELLSSLLKIYPTSTSSVVLSHLLELRSMYPFFGHQRLPLSVTTILNRPPKLSKRCPVFKKTKETKKDLKKTDLPDSSGWYSFNSKTPSSFTSPPPTPYSSLMELCTSSSSLPPKSSDPFNPPSLSFPFSSTQSIPTSNSIFPTASRGSIPFLLGPSCPSPHLSPYSSPVDPGPLPYYPEPIESIHSIAHTLTTLHSQDYHP